METKPEEVERERERVGERKRDSEIKRETVRETGGGGKEMR